MDTRGHILLADDEASFAKNAVQLFEKSGFICHWVPDADGALARLREGTYDVVVADIRMPGNPNLELVREVATWNPRPAMIIVTGYPCTESAVSAVGLPVAAYLIKPFEFESLLDTVENAIQFNKVVQSVTEARDGVSTWASRLQRMRSGLDAPRGTSDRVTLDTVVDMTLDQVYSGLESLRDLNRMMTGARTGTDVCHAIACPRMAELTEVIRDAVQTLEATKSSFKSRRIKELRERLENVLSRGQH